MKIGIDARLWNESGVGRYIRNLVKYLGKLDVGNEYILFLRKPQFENVKCQMSNVKCQKVIANVHWHTLQEQILLPKILAREKLDLVHFPYFSVPIFYKGPFIITIHDLTITHFPTGKASTLPYPAYFLKHLGYQFVLVRAIKKAKKIIVPSKATKKEILDHFAVSEEKIAVTYEGTSLGKDKIEPRSFKSSSLRIKQPYFLYVGNAYPHKNLERLLTAFLKLKTQMLSVKTIPVTPRISDRVSIFSTRRESSDLDKVGTTQNLKLILVGERDFFYEKLRAYVEQMPVKDDVIFYGEANDQELFWLYKQATALVLPSLMEGFGLPALEAMACGCLVLASDTAALKEVCGKVAIYFNPRNIKEMTEKMRGVLLHYDTVQCHSRLNMGLKRAKMFSWQKMAKETLKIYREAFRK